MKKNLFIAAILGICTPIAVAGNTVVDWSESKAGEPPAEGTNHLAHLTNSGEPNSVTILDKTTSPQNPFSGEGRAMQITQGRSPGQKAQSAIAIFDLSSASPALKGTLTMDVYLLPPADSAQMSGLNIVLAPEADPAFGTGQLANAFARVRVTGNFGVQVNIPADNPETISCQQKIVPATPYKVRIDWDLTAAPGYFTVHLNDEPVSARESAGGEAARFQFDGDPKSGIGAVVLMPRTVTSSYIIGRMEMSAAKP